MVLFVCARIFGAPPCAHVLFIRVPVLGDRAVDVIIVRSHAAGCLCLADVSSIQPESADMNYSDLTIGLQSHGNRLQVSCERRRFHQRFHLRRFFLQGGA